MVSSKSGKSSKLSKSGNVSRDASIDSVDGGPITVRLNSASKPSSVEVNSGSAGDSGGDSGVTTSSASNGNNSFGANSNTNTIRRAAASSSKRTIIDGGSVVAMSTHAESGNSAWPRTMAFIHISKLSEYTFFQDIFIKLYIFVNK